MLIKQLCRQPFICAPVLAGLLTLALPARNSAAPNTWSATWGSSQLQPYGTEVLPKGTLEGATLRQVVHLSSGGSRVRLRLSNVFGNEALLLDSVHVALRPADKAAGAINPATDRAVPFQGGAMAIIPDGADYLSDAVDMPVAPLSDLVVTIHIQHAPQSLTCHTGARATSFLAPGNHVSDAALRPAQTMTRWYFLAAVETESGPAGRSLVAFGDSITDGHAATTDGNDRWPDVLAQRLSAAPATRAVGVVNEGIGGNHLLTDGLGPNALSRFDREVLALPNVRDLIVLEGINDIGGLDRLEPHPQAAHDALVQALEAALAQMIQRAREHGIRVLGGTLTPFAGGDYYHPSAATEGDRVALNEWIRHSGAFDGVIDFDAAVRDPARPDRLLPVYDSGDHLHPGPAGYKRMGEAIPLGLLSH